MTMRRRVIKALVTAIIVLMVAIGGFVALTWNGSLHQWLWGPRQLKYTESAYATSRERGAALVAALERWKAAQGEYPSGLGELVPGEIEAIEPPTVGHGTWLYKRTAPDRFELSFFVGPIYESDYYDSQDSIWRIDR